MIGPTIVPNPPMKVTRMASKDHTTVNGYTG